MKNLKDILKKANIMPRLKLVNKQEGKAPVSTGQHKVKLIDSKIVKGTDFMTGKEIYQVKLFVEEADEKKYYLFPLKDKQTGEPHYLVHRLAEFEEGTEVIMEYKPKGLKGFIQITSDKPTNDDIPVIESEDITGDIEEISPDENIEDDANPFQV